MNLIKRLIAFARAESWLHRRRQARALEVLELVFPSKPLVAKHQKTAALHIQLAGEIGWRGKR